MLQGCCLGDLLTRGRGEQGHGVLTEDPFLLRAETHHDTIKSYPSMLQEELLPRFHPIISPDQRQRAR